MIFKSSLYKLSCTLTTRGLYFVRRGLYTFALKTMQTHLHRVQFSAEMWTLAFRDNWSHMMPGAIWTLDSCTHADSMPCPHTGKNGKWTVGDSCGCHTRWARPCIKVSFEKELIWWSPYYMVPSSNTQLVLFSHINPQLSWSCVKHLL